MKKLLILFAAILSLTAVLFGCKSSKEDPNEVLNYLKDLDSYSTSYTMDIINDKQTITYEGKQYFSKSLGYRLEVGQDRNYIYKDNNIYVQDTKNNLKYTLDKNFDDIYKISFIKEYIKLLYTDMEIKHEFKEIQGIKYQLISLTIPGGSREMSKAVLYVDRKTNHPDKILVYDDKGKERRRIVYKNFEANPKLEESLFKN